MVIAITVLSAIDICWSVHDTNIDNMIKLDTIQSMMIQTLTIQDTNIDNSNESVVIELEGARAASVSCEKKHIDAKYAYYP